MYKNCNLIPKLENSFHDFQTKLVIEFANFLIKMMLTLLMNRH